MEKPKLPWGLLLIGAINLIVALIIAILYYP
jgi:hypothetical protein